jgi:hypothetical protein
MREPGGIRAIEMRCEPQARSLLESLRLDSLYPAVIRALGKTSGRVFHRDIEDAVIRALSNKRSTNSKRRSEWLGDWALDHQNGDERSA